MTEPRELLPCPFCGGPVALEEATPTRDRIYGERRWWGVVCRNTTNRGGTCAIEQRPSASQEAAIERWNRRTPQPTQPQAVNQANRPFIVRLAEDFAEECVTAGYVTTKAASYGRLMDEALSTKAQAGAVPPNWPTNEMIEAGRKAAISHGPLLGGGQSLWHVFRDMLAAAPSPQKQGGQHVS